MMREDRTIRDGTISLVVNIYETSSYEARHEAVDMVEDMLGQTIVDRTVTAEHIRAAQNDFDMYEVAIIGRIEPEEQS